jgi:hypothetical protein
MSIGSVNFSEVDGQLGAVNSEALPLGIAGTAYKGSYAPRVFARLADMIDEYGGGDLLEAAAVQLKDWNGQVVACRIQTAASGSASVVSTGWTGTSVPTIHAGAVPVETARYRVKCTSGGIRGVDGILLQLSLDDGRTYQAAIALGTVSVINFPIATAGTLTVDFGAGSMIAGQEFIVNTVAPAPTGAEVATAVTALGQAQQDWDCLEMSCPIDASLASMVDGCLAEMSGREKERYWIGSARLQNSGETLAQYQTAMATVFGSYSNTRAHLFPADMHFVSRVDGRKMRRIRAWAIAPYIERLPRQIDPAQVDNGALPGVSLVDDFGNPELHDEKLSPAFDTLNLGSLYSRGTDGVYIGNARTKSPVGSDYRYVQIRRTINIGKRVLAAFLTKVLSKDVIVSKKTGKMTPSYVRRLKLMAERAVRSVYGVGPMVSDFEVNPDANANVLSTETVPFDFEVIPLGYIKKIPVRVLMKNPALTTV